MFDLSISVATQFGVGLGIGICSVIAPFLLRPFIITGLTLLVLQGALMYAAGGMEAVSTGLSWLLALGQAFASAVMGMAIGRVVAEILARRS